MSADFDILQTNIFVVSNCRETVNDGGKNVDGRCPILRYYPNILRAGVT
jgi:hypothetical protein